jgi:hypothetical protein
MTAREMAKWACVYGNTAGVCVPHHDPPEPVIVIDIADNTDHIPAILLIGLDRCMVVGKSITLGLAFI